MPLITRLTERLKIQHPILLAPMAFTAGGKLAAAVTEAGGLGLVGIGYSDGEWAEAQFRAAGNNSVGCGFITWVLAKNPELLDRVLAHKPRAVMLSFGDPRPFAVAIKEAGALLICQVQTRADAEVAIAADADIIVAQGAEAGGHGEKRGTFTLVPEIADMLAARSQKTLLCAAGGIADGRGLAAALTLGADGVLVGTRLWASTESLAQDGLKRAALTATGDDTVRQRVTDILRDYDWPQRFDLRTMRTPYIDMWLGQERQLREAAEIERPRYAKAAAEADTNVVAPIVGEAIGLIRSIEPAATIIERMVAQAEIALKRGVRAVQVEED